MMSRFYMSVGSMARKQAIATPVQGSAQVAYRRLQRMRNQQPGSTAPSARVAPMPNEDTILLQSLLTQEQPL